MSVGNAVKLIVAPLAFCVLVLGGTSAARADLVAYDPFNYAVGSSLNGQNGGTGFSGAWYAPGTTVQPGLTYPGLPTSGGSSGGFGTRPISVSIGTDNTTLYFSWLEKASANGYDGLALDTGAPNGAFIGYNNSAYPEGFHISDTAGNNKVFAGVPAVAGQTYFLVLKAQFLPGNDRLALYVDPTPGGSEPLTGAVDTSIDVRQPSTVNIYTSGTQSFDELRVGTSFADVTPTTAPLPSVAWCGLALFAPLGVLIALQRIRGRA
jgi:hypothetical protein